MHSPIIASIDINSMRLISLFVHENMDLYLIKNNFILI